MNGKIIKGIAGFYYVHVIGRGVYECKAKGILRNRKIKPLVGDNVDIDILDDEKFLGNIFAVNENIYRLTCNLVKFNDCSRCKIKYLLN